MAKSKIFVGDFETTVYENQTETEVWASAVVPLKSKKVEVHNSIEQTFNYFVNYKGTQNIICYYHNLKFDGAFWLDYLIRVLNFKQASYDNNGVLEWCDDEAMPFNSYKLVVSDMGAWYSITIRIKNGYLSRYIYLRDSLKLLPFSVEQIGKAFNTEHKKLDMEYEGKRFAGCEITDEEKRYIENDVLVVKEALEIMFGQGHKKLTIGSCCLSEFKKMNFFMFKEFFPVISDRLLPEKAIELNPNVVDFEQWVRKSYRGGWCYLVKGKENKIYHNGTTADVNSLYPSVMHSESGNRYPIGTPYYKYCNVEMTADELMNYLHNQFTNNEYYFVHIKCRFKIKNGYLPFIQIKGNVLYKGNECLTTSDIWSEKEQCYVTRYLDKDGIIREAKADLYLTMTDIELMYEHYDIYSLTLIDTMTFNSEIGLFDEYINKYKEIKQNSKGALRTLAKLFLNNLYGKFATSRISSFKVPFLNEDEAISFDTEYAEDENKLVYIPVGSAVTSYARNFTIRAAQKNYYGADKSGFIYADTDSIHCDLPPEKIKGIKVHDTNFNCWKLESSWDIGKFIRQKTYVEHVIAEDLKPIEKPYYNLKCAGMPERCKNIYLSTVYASEAIEKGETEKTFEELVTENLSSKVIKNLSKESKEYIKKPHTIDDFKIGMIVTGKLLPKRIKGGIILKETTYEMR